MSLYAPAVDDDGDVLVGRVEGDVDRLGNHAGVRTQPPGRATSPNVNVDYFEKRGCRVGIMRKSKCKISNNCNEAMKM